MDRPKLAIEREIFVFGVEDVLEGSHETPGLNTNVWDECSYCGDKQLRSLRHTSGWTHDQWGLCCRSCLRWSDDAHRLNP